MYVAYSWYIEVYVYGILIEVAFVLAFVVANEYFRYLLVYKKFQ